MRDGIDEIVCLQVPRPFFGVGAHYVDFSQTSDDEVIRLMDEAERLTDAARGGSA